MNWTRDGGVGAKEKPAFSWRDSNLPVDDLSGAHDGDRSVNWDIVFVVIGDEKLFVETRRQRFGTHQEQEPFLYHRCSIESSSDPIRPLPMLRHWL
jgi:hypothetical protein